MFTTRQSRGHLGALGCLLLLVLPQTVSAEAIQFRNDTTAAVVVQAACIVRGKLLRDRPNLVNPGDKSPAVVAPGDKIITIYDAKAPGRVLFQGVVPASLENQAFSIKPDAKPPGLKLEKIVVKPMKP